MTYNGRTFDEFRPQSASVYIEQEDQHLPELTVRETMDFSALCQGAGHKKGAGSASITLSCGSMVLHGIAGSAGHLRHSALDSLLVAAI